MSVPSSQLSPSLELYIASNECQPGSTMKHRSYSPPPLFHRDSFELYREIRARRTQECYAAFDTVDDNNNDEDVPGMEFNLPHFDRRPLPRQLIARLRDALRRLPSSINAKHREKNRSRSSSSTTATHGQYEGKGRGRSGTTESKRTRFADEDPQTMVMQDDGTQETSGGKEN